MAVSDLIIVQAGLLCIAQKLEHVVTYVTAKGKNTVAKTELQPGNFPILVGCSTELPGDLSSLVRYTPPFFFFD